LNVSTQTAALIQVVLEGVSLPATKAELVDYARREDPDAARLLEALPDREYRSLDEVGEALAPVQPPRSRPEAAVPREESDLPPGGENYVQPHPEPGAVRREREEQSTQAIERASNLVKTQQAKQESG
jgi:hypothetical protein